MKNWVKYLGITFGLGAAVVVPVTTVSITSNNSFVNNDNNSTDNGNDNPGNDNQIPGDGEQIPGGGDGNTDGDGGQIPGDGGDSVVDPKPEVVQPILASSITRNTNFDEIYSSDNPNILENVQNIVVHNQLNKLIVNYDNLNQTQKENLNIKVEAEITSNKWAGQTNYEMWQKSTTKVLYTGNQINVQSADDLYNYLVVKEKLNEIMRENISNSNMLSFSLVSESKIAIKDNALHINVKKNAALYNATTYDLIIPTSSLNLDINSKITISGEEINEQTQDVNLIYDINIPYDDSAINYPKELIIANDHVAISDIFREFNWLNLSTLQTNPDDKIDNNLGNASLNQNQISKDLEVYNVNFKNARIELMNENAPITSSDYNGKHRIIFTIEPKDGYTWENGTKEEKLLKLENVFPRLRQTTWTPEGLNMINKYTVSGVSDIDDIDEMNRFFSDPVNLKNLQKFLNDKINNNPQHFKYVWIDIQEQTGGGLVYKSRTNGTSIRAILKFKEGFDYLNSKTDFVSAGFDIKLIKG